MCAEKGAAEAHYALDNLPNKVLAAEYQTVLPDEKLIAQELTAPAGSWRSDCQSKSGSSQFDINGASGPQPIMAGQEK